MVIDFKYIFNLKFIQDFARMYLLVWLFSSVGRAEACKCQDEGLDRNSEGGIIIHRRASELAMKAYTELAHKIG